MTQENLISLKDIGFAYKKKDRPLLDGLSVNVPDKSIYGFLGRNGAGKSTTIKIITGLLKPAHGQINILGKNLADSRIEILKDVFAIIERPVFYGHLSGYDNLKIACLYRGLDTAGIPSALDLTGLANDKKKFRSYSTGMKQRLCLAAGLMINPRIMILDEPTNGLDPTGIIELRKLIIDLNKEKGITFFVSSHILSEIDNMCTHIGILNKGKLAYEGLLSGLGGASNGGALTELKIKVDNHKAACDILSSAGYSLKPATDNLLRININSQNDFVKTIGLLDNANVGIMHLNYQKQSLEDFYLSIINN